MGITTISLIVKSMCHVIWVAISADVFLSLDCDETIWRGIASSFMTRTNFPHCVGAIDGNDEAFGISKNLMRAYPGSNLTVPKRIFNYRLCRARRYVECSFGILSNKWRIFHRPLKH
nr:unnamed protein product [Callosobruchus chinensis]